MLLARLIAQTNTMLGRPAEFGNARDDADTIVLTGVPSGDETYWSDALSVVAGRDLEIVFLAKARCGISMAAARGCGVILKEWLACGCAALQIDGEDAWQLIGSYACALVVHVPAHLSR